MSAAGEAMCAVDGRMEGRAVLETMRLSVRGAVVSVRRSMVAMISSWMF